MAIGNIFDISAILVVFGAIFIYFGKIIADTKVEKYEKTDLFMQGLFFVLIFIFFPSAVSYFLYQKNLILKISSWLIILVQLIILGAYVKYYNFKGVMLKYEATNEYKKQFNKKINELTNQNKIIEKVINQTKNPEEKSVAIFTKINKILENQKTLLVLSLIILYSNIISVNASNILFLVANGILTFFNLSLFAMAYGLANAYYPLSKIWLTNGKVIAGKTLKFGEFIHLLTKDKKYFINKDQVIFIEQNKMKENGKSAEKNKQ